MIVEKRAREMDSILRAIPKEGSGETGGVDANAGCAGLSAFDAA